MDYKDVKPNVNVDERRDCATGVLLRGGGGGDCSGAPLHICVSHWLSSPEV